MRDWEPVKAICDKATAGSWKVYETDTYENAIGTEWEHAQLKAPAPIVTVSVGVNDTKLYLEKNNADFIATARSALPEAIAEIEQLRIQLHNKLRHSVYLSKENEQLRQDKAELVEVLKDLIRIRDHFIDKRDFDLLESLPDTWEQAKDLIVKHGGAPSGY